MIVGGIVEGRYCLSKRLAQEQRYFCEKTMQTRLFCGRMVEVERTFFYALLLESDHTLRIEFLPDLLSITRLKEIKGSHGVDLWR